MIHRPLQDRYLIPAWEAEEWARDKVWMYAAMVVWSVHGVCADCLVWWFESHEESEAGGSDG